MKRSFSLILIILIISIPLNVYAQRGCCSHHGGVAGCNSNGKQICNDGTLSPSCTCTPVVEEVYGCTDKDAKNYNKNATKDNGTCKYYTYGCTDSNANNYNKDANIDDNSCTYNVYGCTDKTALNYNSLANIDDSSCKYKTNVEDDKNENITNELTDEDENSSGAIPFLLLVGVSVYGIYKIKNR